MLFSFRFFPTVVSYPPFALSFCNFCLSLLVYILSFSGHFLSVVSFHRFSFLATVPAGFVFAASWLGLLRALQRLPVLPVYSALCWSTVPKMEGSQKGTDLKVKRKEGSALERAGNSLFHQILSKRTFLASQEDTKSLLHRLVFLANISPELADKRDLGEFWDQHFMSLQRYYQGESVTGLLLLYPTYAVHVLESSSDALYSVLKTMKEMKKQGNSALLLEPRIVVMSHNIPTRLFQQWNYKVLNVPGSHLGYADQGEPLENIISECLTKLLKLGMHLLKYPRASKHLADSIIEKVPELIIPQATISHLLQCKELLTPGQYLRTYTAPMNIVMDSDVVWPPPVPIKPLEIRS